MTDDIQSLIERLAKEAEQASRDASEDARLVLSSRTQRELTEVRDRMIKRLARAEALLQTSLSLLDILKAQRKVFSEDELVAEAEDGVQD